MRGCVKVNEERKKGQKAFAASGGKRYSLSKGSTVFQSDSTGGCVK
jgi:hypothetical protein